MEDQEVRLELVENIKKYLEPKRLPSLYGNDSIEILYKNKGFYVFKTNPSIEYISENLTFSEKYFCLSLGYKGYKQKFFMVNGSTHTVDCFSCFYFKTIYPREPYFDLKSLPMFLKKDIQVHAMVYYADVLAARIPPRVENWEKIKETIRNKNVVILPRSMTDLERWIKKNEKRKNFN